MFTGIIEELGVVRRARPGLLEIEAELVLTDSHLGDSVAVDGACLTIVEQTSRTFAVNVQPETLRRTTLGEFRVGRRVNLERALAANGRLGGHIVQGHVDGTGQILQLQPDGDGLVARFEAPRSLMRYVVTKGFIAINGISLTVVDVGENWFSVALIQYTRDHVALLDGGVGSRVNLEVDVLAKYVESLLQARENEGTPAHETTVTIGTLEEAGFK